MKFITKSHHADVGICANTFLLIGRLLKEVRKDVSGK